MESTPVTPTRPPLRVAAFVLMAAFSLSLLGWGALLSHRRPPAPDARWATLYRRAGDTYVGLYYLRHAANGSQPEGDSFLLHADDAYAESLRADPSSLDALLSHALVLYALGEQKDAAQALAHTYLTSTRPEVKNRLGNVFLLMMMDKPQPDWVQSTERAVSGLGPGPLYLAIAYTRAGDEARADRFLDAGLARAREMAPAIITALVVCGLILLVGLAGLVALTLRRWGKWTAPPPVAGWGLGPACEAMVLVLFLQVALGVALAPYIGPSSRQMVLLLALALAADLGAIVWVLATASRSGFGWRFGHFSRQLFAGVALGGLIVLPAQGLASLIELSLKRSMAEHPVVAMFGSAATGGTRAFILLSACLLVPVLEETLFRGILYGALRKRGSIAAAVWVSAIVFAAFHASVIGFLPYVLIGAALAWLYERTGSLVASTAAHAAYNTVLMMGLLVLFQ